MPPRRGRPRPGGRRAADPAARAEPGRARDVPRLIADLSDPDHEIRFAAVLDLGQAGAKAGSAAPALTKLLMDPDVNVRSSAAEVLGRLGSKAAIATDSLANLLSDPSI